MLRACIALVGVLWFAQVVPAGRKAGLEPIHLSDDHRGFIGIRSRSPFIPWGFNYDRDHQSRLLEDYWETDWPRVEEDFREMKELGANLVRVHLQFGKFMKGPGQADPGAIDRLKRLLQLAERTGLYLDLTGLGCYRKRDVPGWYDQLDEAGRWAEQARFWEAVAGACVNSPAVFCYDLMNEPVVPGGRRKEGDWLGPPLGEFHYVQVITLDQKDRPRQDIARAWAETLAKSIRRVDPHHLITVGMVDWSLDRPGLTSGFVPTAVAPALDFLAVHLYPKAGKLDEALEVLRGFAAAGKPVVIEETFPLACGADEHRRFLEKSRPHATGWVGFYWGQTPEELRKSRTIPDAMTLGWLEEFRKGRP
ncbi:MAG: cellulase family glycosylhydrolase [Isosphaeraceae bacterium]